MIVSNEVIEWASQQGWEPLPVGWNNISVEPIPNPNDVEVFTYEHDELCEYWYGHPIPHSGGYEWKSPEEVINYYNKGEDIPVKKY